MARGGHHPVGAEGGGDAHGRGRADRLGRPRGGRPGDRRGRRPARLAAARRRTATRCWRVTRPRSPTRGGLGRLSVDHRGLRRPRRAAGSTRRAPSIRPASAAGAGSRRRPPGAPPGFRCTRSGLRASTGRGEASSTGCAPVGSQRVVKPGQVFSRIHVADVAQVLSASIARPNPGRAYNVADDLPSPPEEVIEHACRLLGIPAPPAVPFEAASCHRWRRASGRNRSGSATAGSRSSFGSSLAYPDYRAGTRRGAGGGRVSNSVAENRPARRNRRWRSRLPCSMHGAKPKNGPNGRTR